MILTEVVSRLVAFMHWERLKQSRRLGSQSVRARHFVWAISTAATAAEKQCSLSGRLLTTTATRQTRLGVFLACYHQTDALLHTASQSAMVIRSKSTLPSGETEGSAEHTNKGATISLLGSVVPLSKTTAAAQLHLQ